MAKSECRASSTKIMRAVGSRFDADCGKQLTLVSQDRPVNNDRGGSWTLAIIVTGSHRIKS